MNKNTLQMIERLRGYGISLNDCLALRRVAMTLDRWHALECGDGNGCIERDEKTDLPYWYNANTRFTDPNDPRARRRIPDREKGALKRLAAIMARYPALGSYVQTDPRGLPLYILKASDLPASGDKNETDYNRGIGVGK